MKAYLLYPGRDFDFAAGLPAGHEDLIQDLELATLLKAMAADDKFLSEVSVKVLLASLDDPAAIRYRQQVLADCLAHPEVIRQMYAVAADALEDKRHLWGGYGGTYQNASSNLSGAVSHLEAYVARLRQLRQIADDHAGTFGSEGLMALFGTLQRELDDAYFEEISDHLKQLRFRAGVAQLMMQCGLFVTAQAYQANVTRGIFTHFIREEDTGMTSGRLDDELRRMSVIAGQITPGCLMLFNESFAGTNEREGSEIACQIVRALLDAQIKVFYVTHRFGFADQFRRQHAPTTLFLRAERQPDGSRNYKLTVKDPRPTSFGEDLYYRLGGWLEEDKAPTPAAGAALP
jgi:hypothetical protein